jgi:hypothetical protein
MDMGMIYTMAVDGIIELAFQFDVCQKYPTNTELKLPNFHEFLIL